jgi:hypothetical protein
MTHFLNKTTLLPFLRDCIGATGILFLLVAGIANAQGGTPTYVTCVTETFADGSKGCSEETSGQFCALDKSCTMSAYRGCVCP